MLYIIYLFIVLLGIVLLFSVYFLSDTTSSKKVMDMIYKAGFKVKDEEADKLDKRIMEEYNKKSP